MKVPVTESIEVTGTFFIFADMEENNRKLYPLRFIDEGADTPWGHVSYHIADLGFKDSMVDNGWFGGNTLSELMSTYLERVVGDDAFEFYGLQFPVLVKVITTRGWQPLQVNAPDEAAAERYDSLGKTAFWYIEEAREDARMYLGLNRDVDAGEFHARCQNGNLAEILNEVHPKAGATFLIKPGTVFAAGPGLKIVEIAESSELTFNLHDWGEELAGTEEILLEEAFDLIDFNRHNDVKEEFAAKPEARVLAHCQEFTVTKLMLDNPIHLFSEQPGSFGAYYCLSGEAVVSVQDPGEGTKTYPLKKGHSILVPSEVNDFYLIPESKDTVLLETLVERRLVRDSYTGGDVKPVAFPVEEAGNNAHEPDISNWN